MINRKQLKILLFVVVFLIFSLIIVIITTTGFKKKKSLRVGFIMTGTTTEQGWNKLHYDGIKEACDQLDAKLLVKENIKENEGQCEQAVHDLAEERVDIIILSSYGYAAEIADITKDYPDITFYSESFDHGVTNIKSYFARMYQARYLTGIIAGMQTKSNTIGYVAAMANSEVNRGINAFTLGVQRVNPDAKVIVAWSNSWDDADREKKLAASLIDEKNVDVITYHQNQPNIIEIAEQKGIASIGYHEAIADVSDNFLTAAEFHLGPTYREILLDYSRGQSDVIDTYWIGIEQDAVGLTDYSPKVTKETITIIENAKQEIMNGYDVFSGIIYDTEHKLRCDEGETIDDEQLLKYFDWYVEGVEFYEE